nr:hypothetical protein [Armatimonas sp.]
METSMSYSELKIYKTIENTDIDRIKGRLINRIYASEKKRNMNNGLSEIDILDKYFFDLNIYIFTLESKFYTGFICAGGFSVHENGVEIFHSDKINKY